MNIKRGLVLLSLIGVVNAAEVSFSGENWLQTLIGKKENAEKPGNYFDYDEYQNQGWRYVRDVFTYNIGIDKFTFDGKLYIDQPTMGFHPTEKYYYRELIKRRTLAWNGDKVKILAGNFETGIGRGLSLSLQDDHTVELSNILDGVLLSHENNLFSATVFAGRGQEKNSIVTLDPGSDKESDYQNYNYRDGLYGFYSTVYPFLNSDRLSSTAIGAGLLLMRDGVDDFELHDVDTTDKKEEVSIQKRNLIWIPSINLSLELGPVDFYSEYVRLVPQIVAYDDSLLKEEFVIEDQGYAAYMATTLSLGDFIINGEYLNYFYSRQNSYYGAITSQYTDAPTGRHKQKWHLLTKHTVTPSVGDLLGYNSSVSWLGLDGHEFMILASIGGTHKRDVKDKPNDFAFEKNYDEIYVEWNGNLFDKVESKVGLDIGTIDKDHPEITSYTLGGDFQSRELFNNWGLGLALEGQFNSQELRAAKNLDKLREIVIEQMPDEDPEEISELDLDTFKGYLKERKINKESGDWDVLDKSWLNTAIILKFYFKGNVTISTLLERETLFRNDYTLAIVDDIDSRSEWYKSINVEANLTKHHTLEFAVGDFSRSKICNMGTCTKVPSYRGMKLTFKSTF